MKNKKKKTAKKDFWIGWTYDKVYRVNLRMIAGDVKKAQRKIEKWTGHHFDLSKVAAKVLEFYPEDNNGGVPDYIVYIRDQKNIPVVTHECLHLVHFIFDIRQLKLDPENDEAYTYYLEYWVREVLAFLNEIKD